MKIGNLFIQHEVQIPPSTARWLAWSLVGVYFLFGTVGIGLQILAGRIYVVGLSAEIISSLVIWIWGVIGAMIITRHPRLPIGWILSLIPLVQVLDLLFFGTLAYDHLVYTGEFPGTNAMMFWMTGFSLPAMLPAGTLLLLLFPNGRFVSPTWRIVFWISTGALSVLLVLLPLAPGTVRLYPFVDNPFAVSESAWKWLGLLTQLANLILMACLLAAIASLYVRYRLASRDERQQIKWIAYAASFFPLGMILWAFGSLNQQGLDLLFLAGFSLEILSLVGMAVAIGIAIFKYRLYEINLLINTTLVYGTLTTLVIGLYLAIVGFSSLMLQTGNNLLGLFLIAIVLVTFYKPIKEWLQLKVDRIAPREMKNLTIQQTLPPKFIESQGLSGRWLLVARIAWVILALFVLGILISALPGYLQRIKSGLPSHGPAVETSPRYAMMQILNSIASLFSASLSFFLATLLFRRKFANPAVAATAFYLLLYSAVMTGPLEFWGTYWLGHNDFAITAHTLIMATPTVAIFVLFPNGRFVPGWARWILIISLPWNLVALLVPIVPFQPEQLGELLFLGFYWLALLGLGFYTQFYRYRYVSTPIEHQQTKWVLFGFFLWIGYMLLSTFPFLYLTNLPPEAPQPWWSAISELGWWLSLSILPVSLTIAVTRSRLWDIDIVINRTLVYGTLTIATMTLYILIVGALGSLLQVGNNAFLAFLTTGLVALLFQPLRDRLQHWVNRLMYGERDNPVSVLSQLGAELEHTGSPEDALSSITRTVATSLKLPYVAIQLGESGELAASYGIPNTETLRLPMTYQNETSGHLLVAPRSAGEPFNETERRLLENIAQQAGAAAHAAKLTTDLRLSRQHLVTAREEERRRIRRDLHDGLGPQLASQTLTLTAARRLLEQDPQAADDLLKEAIKHAQAATEDVRRVVYELRPPALDDLGLTGALRAQAQRFASSDLKIELELPEKLDILPAAVEVACFMIFQEALTNIVRHANATHCHVTVKVAGDLLMEILDNGIGISKDRTLGVGLNSMRQRAEELGGIFQVESQSSGGTQLSIRLPLMKEE